VSCTFEQHGIIGNNIQATGIKLIFDLGNCRIDAISHPSKLFRSGNGVFTCAVIAARS
jgi:hypothetical protein